MYLFLIFPLNNFYFKLLIVLFKDYDYNIPVKDESTVNNCNALSSND